MQGFTQPGSRKISFSSCIMTGEKAPNPTLSRPRSVYLKEGVFCRFVKKSRGVRQSHWTGNSSCLKGRQFIIQWNVRKMIIWSLTTSRMATLRFVCVCVCVKGSLLQKQWKSRFWARKLSLGLCFRSPSGLKSCYAVRRTELHLLECTSMLDWL